MVSFYITHQSSPFVPEHIHRGDVHFRARVRSHRWVVLAVAEHSTRRASLRAQMGRVAHTNRPTASGGCRRVWLHHRGPRRPCWIPDPAMPGGESEFADEPCSLIHLLYFAPICHTLLVSVPRSEEH